MVSLAPERLKLPVPVLERPQWRVLIRPEKFVPDRIRTMPELLQLLEASTVRLRGSEYPSVRTDPGSAENGSSHFASWDQYQNTSKYLRFHQSGQFIHLFGFREDSVELKARGDAWVAAHRVPIGFKASGYVDFQGVLFTVTEIFQFAARLAARSLFDERAVVEIGMEDVQDRLLVSLDWRRHWTSFCPATAPRLSPGPRVINTAELIGASPDLALDMAEWFYDRFQWTRRDRKILREDQRKFLNRIWD